MMRSLYSGVAGLRTHQTKMDVLGNNIANVNTTSYKSQSITFSDLMYQTTQNASGATQTKGGVNARQIGLGAKSGAINTAIESQGATQTTNNPFDIMITGKSFFVVNNGKENLYTRDGSFYVDGAGNLAMQSNGYFVMGWGAKEDPDTGEIKVDKNSGLTSLQIMSAANSTYSPAATTAALFSGNIDDNDTNIISDDGKTITLEFYDNKGYLYTGKFTLKDTGTDNLFSLQLTDILDSNGLSIGKDLMKGVTFGSNSETTEGVSTTDNYSVTVNKATNVATVSLAANSPKYTNVPLTGNLKDLMSTDYSKKAYAGVLEEAYCLKDIDVTDNAEFGKFYSSATYSIDSASGELTIQWTESDKMTSTDFTFTSAASGTYYYNSTTGKAYRVPDKMNGVSYDTFKSNKYVTEVFSNLFKNSSGTAPALDADHTYTFDGTTLTVSKNCSVTQATSYTEMAVADMTGHAGEYTPADMAAKLEEYSNTYPDYPVFYTFDGTNISIKKAVPTGATTQSRVIDFSSANPNATSAALKTKLDISTLDANLTDDAKTTLLSGTSYTDIASFIAGEGYDKYAFTSSSGSYGIVFYKNSDTYAAGDELYSGSVEYDTFTMTDSTYTKTSASSFAGVWYSNSKGYDYLIDSKKEKVSDYSQDFLTDVFGMTPAQITSYADSTVTFSNKNMTLSTNHSKAVAPSQAAATLYPSYNQENGTMSFLTISATDVDTFTSSELTGNITDLIGTSTGPHAGTLSKVWGISDDDARAYGTDGKYKINDDGTISLETGDKTIMLKFDPANGELVSANGIANGLVTLHFENQDTEKYGGLEPFGFQPRTADEQERSGNITVDLSTVTNFNTSGTATITAVKGDKKSLNTGRMVGEMNGVTVSTNGEIHATYSNGQTKLLGQIASAEFANASGLSKEGDNLYASTLNSGEATVQDITVDGGYMNTGVLEMSNVDLSKEFTEMITTQRGFQANSRIITVSDTLLEELTNLKR